VNEFLDNVSNSSNPVALAKTALNAVKDEPVQLGKMIDALAQSTLDKIQNEPLQLVNTLNVTVPGLQAATKLKNEIVNLPAEIEKAINMDGNAAKNEDIKKIVGEINTFR
jgi:hypothetical protein